MHPIVYLLLIIHCSSQFVIGIEKTTTDSIDITDDLKEFVGTRVVNALRNWHGLPLGTSLELLQVCRIIHRPVIDDDLHIEAVLSGFPTVCNLRLNGEQTKLNIKCGYREWQLVGPRLRRETNENEGTVVDESQWAYVSDRVKRGLEQLRQKLTVQYLPLNLMEILSIRQLVLSKSEKLYVLEGILGMPPSRCTLKLYQPKSSPERLTVVCGQNELSISITHRRERRSATRNLSANEMHKAANKLEQALALLQREKGVRLTLFRVHGGQRETVPDAHYNIRAEFVVTRKKHIICRAKLFSTVVEVKCGKEIHSISTQI